MEIISECGEDKGVALWKAFIQSICTNLSVSIYLHVEQLIYRVTLMFFVAEP